MNNVIRLRPVFTAPPAPLATLQFVVTPSGLVAGWAVRCEGETLSTHFTQIEALQDAQLRAAETRRSRNQNVRVYIHRADGRYEEAPANDP